MVVDDGVGNAGSKSVRVWIPVWGLHHRISIVNAV